MHDNFVAYQHINWQWIFNLEQIVAGARNATDYLKDKNQISILRHK